MKNPLITVITPYYNNAETYYLSMDSVLTQTYPAIQYILVDDGSRDFDEEAIRAHFDAEKRPNIAEFLILRNETNLGTVKALNRALDEAESEYIYTLAADDCFADDEVLSDWTAEFLRTGAMVLTAKRNVYDNGMKTYLSTAPDEKQISMIQTLSPEELFEALTGSNFIFSCCTAYTKRCYNLVGGLDERYRLVEDYPMNLKLLRQGVRFTFFDRVVIRYRRGGVSNAVNIDHSYVREADEIFYNESYPYAKHKCKARRAYHKWRSQSLAMRDANALREKYRPSESFLRKFVFLSVMTLLHPFYMLKKLFLRKKKA